MDHPPQPTVLRGPIDATVISTYSTIYHPQESQDMFMVLDPKVVVELECTETMHWKTRSTPPSQIDDFKFESPTRSVRWMSDLAVLAHSDDDAWGQAENTIAVMLYSLMNSSNPLPPQQLASLHGSIMSFARDMARSLVSTAGLVQLTLVVQIRLYAMFTYHEGSTLSPQPVQACQERMALKREIYEDVASDSEAKECSICLEAFVVGAVILQLPCKHGFHEGCIVTWMSRSPSCPLCRTDLRPYTILANSLSQLLGAGVAQSLIQSIYTRRNLF